MKHITEMQNSKEVVHVIPEADAIKLINDGYVRKATIDPAPKDGVAVNLTAKGRGYQSDSKSKAVEAPKNTVTAPAS